jgi:hypothetical protein
VVSKTQKVTPSPEQVKEVLPNQPMGRNAPSVTQKLLSKARKTSGMGRQMGNLMNLNARQSAYKGMDNG